MVAQAFFYNAIFFTYALISDRFLWHPGRPGRLVPSSVCGGEFSRSRAARPAVRYNRTQTDDRVHLCDLWAAPRRQRLSVYDRRNYPRTTQTIAWMVIFFFASAAASSAYLTVSETFPLESGLSRSLSSSRWEQASAASSARSCSAYSSIPDRARACLAATSWAQS